MERTRIPEECDQVIGNLTEWLTARGLQVHLSFDLQSARKELADPNGCPCPYHGTADCSCQYIVMLVSRDGLPPISIVAHGYEDHTYLTAVPDATAPVDPVTLETVEASVSRLVSPMHPPQA